MKTYTNRNITQIIGVVCAYVGFAFTVYAVNLSDDQKKACKQCDGDDPVTIHNFPPEGKDINAYNQLDCCTDYCIVANPDDSDAAGRCAVIVTSDAPLY